MGRLSIAHALGVCLLCVCVSGITVHFNTPAGYGGNLLSSSAGLYRVTVDVDTLLQNRTAYVGENIKNIDHTCVSAAGSTQTGLDIRSMSFDSEAKKTYLQISKTARYDLSTVFYGDTCRPEKDCYGGPTKHGPTPMMYNFATKDSGYIVPIASHADVFYFIYTPDTRREAYFGYRPYLQLRKVNTNYAFIVDKILSPAVSVDSFSVALTNISVEGDHGRRWLLATNHLLVVPSTNGQLILLTVVRNVLFPDPPNSDNQQEFRHLLVAVKVDPDGTVPAESKIVHTTNSWQGWYSYSIGDEGGISYKEGTLCWTTVDTLHCGDWTPENGLDEPTNIATVIAPSQANHVCNGTYHGNDLYINVTTGVAVVETVAKDGHLVLFFGCYASLYNRGGMGMVVNEPGKDMQILRIVDNEGPLLAGSMFATEDDMCPKVPDTPDQSTPSTVSAAPCRPLGRSLGDLLVCVSALFLLMTPNFLIQP